MICVLYKRNTFRVDEKDILLSNAIPIIFLPFKILSFSILKSTLVIIHLCILKCFL